jgi:hypothetical protein
MTFRNLHLFPSSGEGRESPTLLGPVILRGQQSRCLPPLTWGRKSIQFLKRYVLYFYLELAVPGMRCNASRKPPSRSTSHEVR